MRRAMPAAGRASTSSCRAAHSRPSALVVRARTQVDVGRPPKESRVGKVPIPVPAGTNVTLENAYIKVKVRPSKGRERIARPMKRNRTKTRESEREVKVKCGVAD